MKAAVDSIPAELVARHQWVVWRQETRKGDKPTKVLYQAKHPARKAKVNDPATWATFEQAKLAAKLHNFDGIGYVFAEDDPYVGIDLDRCLREDGEVEAWARSHVASLGKTYGEVSPSGRGIKFIARGKLPGTGKRRNGYGEGEKAGAIEVYDRGRFFTITGDIWDNQMGKVVDLSDVVSALYVEVQERPEKATAPAPKPLAVRAPKGGKDPISRASAYLAKVDPAVSGNRGHDQAFKAACKLVEFGLEEAAVFRLLWEEYNPRCVPPWSEAELRHKVEDSFRKNAERFGAKLHEGRNGHTSGNGRASSNGRGQYPGPPTAVATSPGADVPINRTDLGNARRLVARHGGQIRYCFAWGQWLTWDGRRWREDPTGEILRLAKRTVATIGAEAAAIDDENERKATLAFALKSESKKAIDAMVSLAQSEPGVPVVPSQLDRDPLLLNVENGTIDLRTGELHPHNPADLITKLAPVQFDPDAGCPTWLGFLGRAMDGDDSLIGFLQRAAGYGLTGDVSEHSLFFLYGSGRNGKSTFLGTIQKIAGDYATTVNASLITSKVQEDHPTGLCDLDGRRFVSTIEVEDGKRLAEALVKVMTGGDRLKGRRMRQDFYEFDPTHKLFLAANHKPEIRGTDDGIWSRIKLVPFNVTIPKGERDRNLGKKLLAEAPGILAWLVRGCLEWQRKGLAEPEIISQATEDYRSEMDTFGDFLRERCFLHSSARCKGSELYDAYKAWCEHSGHRPLSSKKFGNQLNARKIGHQDSNGVRWRVGIGLPSSGRQAADREGGAGIDETPF